MSYSKQTYSELKTLASSMSNAFRNSLGGGIMERFENVSKLLFLKMYSEKHGIKKDLNPFIKQSGKSNRETYERARALWREIVTQEKFDLPAKTMSFPDDVDAVASCVNLLKEKSICASELDARGAAYEEMLRNTFEKNENQQYFTPSPIVNFVVELSDAEHAHCICDPACGSGGFLIGALEKARCSADATLSQFHGFDIDERMIWVAKTNMLIHDGEPSNIRYLSHSGSLGNIKSLKRYLPKGGVDLILANPPFGSDMTDTEALKAFITGKGRNSRRRSVLFIERSLQLLAPGGKLGIIVDDSVLNLDGNEDVRQVIRKEANVLAVISLPDVAFMPYSTAKSSVLLLQKKKPGMEQGRVFMARADQVGKRPNGDVLYDETGSVVSDLPAILNFWKSFVSTGSAPHTESPESYSTDLEDDASCRLDFNYYHPSKDESLRTIENSADPVYRLDELFDFMGGSVKPSTEYGDEPIGWIGLADIESKTGVFAPKTVMASSIKSQAHRYRSGDILVSRLRPELRKAVLIPDGASDGICSSELVVLRKKEVVPVDFSTEYVANALRSDLAYGQEVCKITGLGRPRIGIPVLKSLLIPIPEAEEQNEVTEGLSSALERYKHICSEADCAKKAAREELMRAYDTYTVEKR